ncbi:hypothetical protein [Thalassobacillus sp. B23F22_16]|uniref:hypothetical protein n=1 Tax=Thalassobacillus sp. B23F22_16 TaxID=3459513 RepID=UPI00373EC0EC
MARTRNKEYKQGDRINLYLSQNLPDDFIEWINSQSDLSNFFLFAAQQLYKQTGNIDVAEVMPRKLRFNLEENPSSRKLSKENLGPNLNKSEINTNEPYLNDSSTADNKEKSEAWESLDEDIDDPYA